jgi:hypothetical protein
MPGSVALWRSTCVSSTSVFSQKQEISSIKIGDSLEPRVAFLKKEEMTSKLGFLLLSSSSNACNK